jgi:hypothetical protein
LIASRSLHPVNEDVRVIETSPFDTDISEEIPEDTPRYEIDPSWFDENGLSFHEIVRARICDACRAKMGSEVEERVAVFDKEAGRPKFELRRTAYGSEPMRVIREHCGRAKNYINRDMPTLEAIFRIFLANGNQPMPLQHVREQLAEWCPGGGCQWLLLPLETLDRLVKNDRFYGLRQANVSTEGD